MKTFFRTLFFSIILGAFMAVPASYFFVKDFVQPRVQETLSRIDTLNTDLQNQNQMLEQILSQLNQSN
jgi:hypothetical protein